MVLRNGSVRSRTSGRAGAGWGCGDWGGRREEGGGGRRERVSEIRFWFRRCGPLAHVRRTELRIVCSAGSNSRANDVGLRPPSSKLRQPLPSWRGNAPKDTQSSSRPLVDASPSAFVAVPLADRLLASLHESPSGVD